MSRYIATRAIRGANALVTEAESMLQSVMEQKGPDTPLAFPNTAYHLPLIFGMTGREIDRLDQLPDVLAHARKLLHPMPSDRQWTPYLGETLDSGMATLIAAEAIEAMSTAPSTTSSCVPGASSWSTAACPASPPSSAARSPTRSRCSSSASSSAATSSPSSPAT